ncbi:hypothetical protein ACP4OV_008382 [Aristida adscensionis]
MEAGDLFQSGSAQVFHGHEAANWGNANYGNAAATLPC